MKPRPRKSPSLSSAASGSKSESDGSDSQSDASSTMASMKSQDTKRSNGSATSASRASTPSASRASSLSASRDRASSCPSDGSHESSSGRPAKQADFKSTTGLMQLIQSTIAKFKKKGGCPITTIKKDIKENHGYTLTGTHNTRRLNVILKNLQKEGKLVKTARGYRLVPIAEARRRRRVGARRGTKKRRMSKGRRKARRKRGIRVRRRRLPIRRRGGPRGHAKRSKKATGRRRAMAPKSAKLGSSKGGNLPNLPSKGPSMAGGGGKDVPGGSSLNISSKKPSKVRPLKLPLKVPSKVPSRASSRLPSRSHSPAEAY